MGSDPDWQQLLMSSVDGVAQLAAARRMGSSTFRVLADGEQLRADEFACPKAAEAGRRLTCSQCAACAGGTWSGRPTPAILLHGTLPAMRQRFAQDPRRFAVALPVLEPGVPSW
jgi:hypothetical protein